MNMYVSGRRANLGHALKTCSCRCSYSCSCTRIRKAWPGWASGSTTAFTAVCACCTTACMIAGCTCFFCMARPLSVLKPRPHTPQVALTVPSGRGFRSRGTCAGSIATFASARRLPNPKSWRVQIFKRPSTGFCLGAHSAMPGMPGGAA